MPEKGLRPVATFVLVHGAWLGGWCWQRVTPLLRQAGSEVYTPTLTGLGERSHLLSPDVDFETHVRDIVGVLECEDLHDVVLLGHSYGGMVITAVASRCAPRLAQLIYLDAFVPRDGQSLLDLSPPDMVSLFREQASTVGGGWRVPPLPLTRWAIQAPADLDWLSRRLGPQPLRTFDRPVRLGDAQISELPRTYIRCAAYPGFTEFGDRAREDKDWRYRELQCSHGAMVTHPRELADLLLELSQQE
jgi:pimeloyl-ACP methyl ester carboxylesterase